MATAQLKDVSERVHRVTGAADVPLNKHGREQAAELGKRTAGKFDRVYASPLSRTMETARAVDPKAQKRPALAPWKLGRHEGKPVDSEKDAMNERITMRPYSPTGASEYSGAGESFHQFQTRFLSGVQEQKATMKPGERILNVTHGRNLRLMEAWLKNGAPADRSIDKAVMVGKQTWSGNADLFHVEGGKLSEVDDATKPGMYFARHGQTNWNAH